MSPKHISVIPKFAQIIYISEQWNLDLVNHQIVNFRKIVNFLGMTNFLINKSLELVNFSRIIKI